MTKTRNIDVFSAGCPLCDDAVALVEAVAGPSHQVRVLDLHEAKGVSRARGLGVRTAPAVAVDGELLDCCEGRGFSERALRESLGETPNPKTGEEPPRRRGCC